MDLTLILYKEVVKPWHFYSRKTICYSPAMERLPLIFILFRAEQYLAMEHFRISCSVPD